MGDGEETLRLAEIATLVDGEICGDTEEEIIGVASIEEARPGDIVFAESEKYLEAAARSKASAILAPRNASATTKKALVLTENPRLAFVQVLESFQTPLRRPEGIHPTAILGQGVRIGEDVRIGANVVVGDRVVLGDRVTLFPGVSIGDDCALGEDSVLHPNVVLYSRVILGKRCLLHSGCVLGADGFGYVPVGATLRKVPQLGTVEVGDEVEIGANSCIDRAKTGATVIGSFTKIDNLVHVGHNVRVGHHSILIAQVGIAGGTQIGNGVILAGQSGVVDHVTIGDGARVGAQGGVVGDVPAGQTYSGYPARPHAEKMREYAALALLPDYLKRIRALEKRLAALEET